MDDQFQKTLDKLRAIRQKKGLSLKPSPYMKTEITALDGMVRPFKLRDYQVQMVFHLLTMPRFIVGDDTGLGKCVTRDTLIETQRGLVPVGQLQPCDMMPDTFSSVEGWQVRLGDEMVPVKSFYYGGPKPTRKVRTRYGFEVEGSLVHPLLARCSSGEEWRQTQEIAPGDFLCVDRGGVFPGEEPSLTVPVVGGRIAANTKTYPVPDRLNPELARLLGYIVGEGWVNAKYEFSISQCPDKNPEVHADISALLENQFGWVPSMEGQKDTHIWSVFLRTYLEHMGVDYTLSADKTVPEPVLRGTRASVREFLRGLFEGEASAVGTGGIEFSTASEVLGKQVQLLLLRFGILAKRSPKKVSAYPDKTYWRLALFGDDARKFADEIGFVSSRKTNRLAGVLPECSNPNHDTIPCLRETVEALREPLAARCQDLGWLLSQRWGSSFYNTLGHIRHGRRNPTYRFLREFLDICYEVDAACTARGRGLENPLLSNEPAFRMLRRHLDQHYFYDPIVEVTSGFKEVVDIEVADSRHAFVGNGLVNHNTAESIGALCYLWMRDPNEKAIILTKKSAIGQWAKEFEKFTEGVNVIVVRGTPAKRYKLYQEYLDSTGPTVMITNYRSVVNDLSVVQDWEDFTLIADECFQYHTPITLADGSTELIGKIVSQKMPVEVLSWDPETGAVEPRRVVHWHRNSLRRGKRKNLLHLKFRFGGKVRVTRTHKFYSPEGQEVPAAKLRKGSEIQHLSDNVPTEDQWQVILGGLLGDSCLSHPNRPRWGICFGHATKQEGYLRFKRDLLTPLGVSDIDTTPNEGFPLKDGGEKGYARFRLCANEAVTSFLVQSRVQRGGKKRVTLDWLDSINPLGLAVWYADDGSITNHECLDGTVSRYITLNTQGFTREEVELLAGWLRWKWGVNAEVKTTKPRTDREGGRCKSYPYLHLSPDASDKFLGLLPCGFPGVEYKFPNKAIASSSSFDTAPVRGLVVDWLTEKRVWGPPDTDKDRYVYNLEVEGNHNYFANGSLVSNCTMFKNPSTQVHQVMRHMAGQAKRVWGLTATLIKNNLIEGFGIYQVVVPGLFRHSKTGFMKDYCILRMVRVKGNRQVPQIVGYRDTDIQRFKDKIEPYYLGRPKHDVAEELPVLQTKDVYVGLTSFQHSKYQEALGGLLELGNGEEKETDRLTAIIYCQEIVNHPVLLGYDKEKSEKLDTLADMLTEGGELEDEKVIVFTRFKKMVDYAIPYLEKKGVKCVRVTGQETDEQRQDAMEAFQDHKSDVKVIWITMAGGDAINLQAAKALVFFDTPWSAGDYLQCLDSETEILTPDGFKRRGGIRVGDLVAALDPTTSEITWCPARSVVDRPLATGEKIFAMQSRHVDVRVTGGHRMLFKRKTYRDKRSVWSTGWQFETAEEMAAERSHYQIPASGVQEAPGVPLADIQLEFIGWYLSDGHINTSNAQLVISQAAHQPQIHDLRRCIRECGFDWSEYDRDPDGCGGFPNGKPQIVFSIPKGTEGSTRSRNGWVALSDYLDKDLSPLLENLTADQLGHLLHGLHLGDGSKYRGGDWTQRSYHVYTSNRTFADRLQSLCVRRGYRCNLAVRPANLSENRKEGYTLHIKRDGVWSFCGWKGDTHRPRLTPSQVGPGEQVWCVENDKGTLVTRRNGKVVVVGNCLGRMIRIGSLHDRVYAIHLIAEDTVDERVQKVKNEKMKLIQDILGQRIRGEKMPTEYAAGGGTRELFDHLVSDARRGGK